jgi:DNA-binding Lrp family transcriptional regulator
MAKAYVKIWVEGGREEAVRDELLGSDHVMVADITSGDQDIMTLVESESFEELLQLVVKRIRRIPGVTRTSTNLVLE